MSAQRACAALLALGSALFLTGCAAATLKAVPAPGTAEVESSPLREAVAPVLVRIEDRVYSNRVKWKTASEVDNFGYDVYRGESPEGPFERITREVIEGAGTTDEPTAYEYVDRGIDPYLVYYYYVESISMNGDRERFTPIGRAKPKIEAREPETSADEPGQSVEEDSP